MLPHILHSTGRAVAIVHNQTNAIRNVLQPKSSGPSSGSGSTWGNGPGPGGSKYGAGSRFHAGYNNAGRAVIQANAVTSHDGQSIQADDQEELAPKRSILPTSGRKPRMRSSSVSMGSGRKERGEKLGVLKTVQLHTRGKHAFAPDTMASAKERLLAEPLPVVPPTTQPLLVRRNSTSAPLSPLLKGAEAPVPSPAASKQAEAPKRSTKEEKKAPKHTGPFEKEISHLRYLANTGDNEGIAKAVRQLLAKHEKPSVEVFNAILSAYAKTRAEGSPLGPIIDVYNVMLNKSVLPNVETYETLILVLTTRDQEIHRVKLSMDVRMKKRPLIGRSESTSEELDQERRAQLEKEDNFGSAMSLFEGVLAVGGKDQLQPGTFVRLMSCAANHSDVHAAIHIFAQLESLQIPVAIPVYRYLILVFSNNGQIDQAEEIFKSFLEAGTRNRLARYPASLAHTGRQAQIMVWNTMIEAYFRAGAPEKAIELVDQVLRSEAGNNFTAADVPIPTSSMFSTVINGFLQSGDIASALSWFDKLLSQRATPADPFEGLSGVVMRPDGYAWFLMLDALAEKGQIEDLNRLFKVLKSVHAEDNIAISRTIRLIFYTANLEHVRNGNVDRETAIEALKYLLQDLEETRQAEQPMPLNKLSRMVATELVALGELDFASRVYYDGTVEYFTSGRVSQSDAPRLVAEAVAGNTQAFIERVYHAVYTGTGTLSFVSALLLARLAFQLELKHDLLFAPVLLNAYGLAKNDGSLGQLVLSPEDWDVLFTYASYFEINALDGNPAALPQIAGFAFAGVLSLLEDFQGQGAGFESLSGDARQRVVGAVDRVLGPEARQELFASYGSAYLETAQHYDELRYRALENAVVQAADMLNPVEAQLAPLEEPQPLQTDAYLSQAIFKALGPPTGTALPAALEKAYTLFENGAKKGMAPAIFDICRLIEGSGRLKDLDKVRELYTAAQSVLQTLAPEEQRYEWAAIENSMVIALAHAGHVDAAHVHRVRILEQGLAPSADAYGILVQLVKDTTDDTSGAISLFQEAVERGVKPNMYLYNNIISKLSKARKADYALELFQQMKASGVRVSSITYGTVIGACARVGDVASAESLFKEMTRSRNFKPRVPPYNTMMQLHTTTKPNRTSALYYYNEMRKAGVRPSAHTYKLLLDTYGSLEPVALEPMEKVFAELLEDTSVEVTGAHFASLINAYGCVSKDLDKAISIFESMGTYPRAPKPDAVAFEAIINAIVAHKQTDLLPVYVNKMVEAGVHMTAYIANFLIKGYANVGDLDKAREIFEALSNPPTGVAAPNNHAPHSPEMGSDVPVMAPVYREPSTWEVMVRAELGAGNRDAALDLLERLRERQYPEAVYSRISGILTDFSIPQ
ncbi:hypothetical protein BDN70DRAFT_813231 [Pholiota conissans]|uniref:Pentatricopeptide repeat-containing protein n=1 Tax=Pholiota conissans TaxID=109636 RepID=A0A9P5YXY5_9AGAR|nr:hypothetical protein BDN70DRAFT_813231 [Pholiota conissans]